MKKRSRTWERVCIVLTYACQVFLVLTLTGNPIWLWLIPISLACISLIRYCFLRCPNCGSNRISLKWKEQGETMCPKCGSRLEYDDAT